LANSQQLKDELDFQGLVMSDWSAQHSGVASALAGLDMSMPGDVTFNSGDSYFGGNMTMAVLNGSLPIWRVDDMATRIMSAYYFTHQDKNFPETNMNSWTTDDYGYLRYYSKEHYGLVNKQVDVRGQHHKIIRELSAKANILLKNSGVLPLTGKEKQIALFGSDAGESPYGPNGHPDRGGNDGTLAMGWGSGTANFPYLVTPLEAIKAKALQFGQVVQSVLDNYAYSQIKDTAGQASVCLTFVSADSGEGYIDVDGNRGDRKNLTLWHNGDDLIKTVASTCKNTVVVIHSVGPVLLEEWIDHPNVTAVLFAGLPGQESGNSLTDVLYGAVNPSGRLPFTIAKHREDYGVKLTNSSTVAVPQQDFTEGLFIDYRHFDKNGITPRYEFGYGLSYTTFKYSHLNIRRLADPAGYKPAKGMQAKNDAVSKELNPADYLFPKDFSSWKVRNFVYPYIKSVSDVKQGSYPAPKGAYDTSAQPVPAAGGAPGGNPSLYENVYEVSVVVTNTGKKAGEEVVQVYLETGLADDPKVVLRQFEKVMLRAGESKTVKVKLTRRDLMRWNVVKQDWTCTEGKKVVHVGCSSRQFALSATLA
jgi:beta-glucosidase